MKRVTALIDRGRAPDYVDDGPVRAISQAANQSLGFDWTKTRYHDYHGDPERLRGRLLARDILINSTGTGTLGRVGYFTDGPDAKVCMADGHVTVVRTIPELLDPRFCYYWLSSHLFQEFISAALTVGATNQIELSRERLRDASIALPPLDEQRRIVQFLDIETTRIDTLRNVRGRQVSALRERELAAILASLSGADSPGDRRTTGWPWMPEIPAGWRTAPVYSAYDVQLGKMLNAERATGERLRPYLRNANVTWYGLRTDDLALMNIRNEEKRRYSVRPGDLLVCEGGAGVAEAAVWRETDEEIFYSKSLHRIRRRSDAPVEWLMYWLRIAKSVGLFESEGNIATIPHLTAEQLRGYRIPITPDAGRRVRVIAEQVASINRAVTALHRASTLALERRQALIAAAVTGEIDVTTTGLPASG